MKTLDTSRDSGFSLVEVCIAILVGVIVLTMAISVLFSTFSSGAALLSKQQVSTNTRFALSRILKDVASAQSTLRCTVWKSNELQSAYEVYLRRIENGGDDPATPAIESGTPTFSGSSADCLEYYETGHVMMRVLPNSMCWFLDLSPGSDDVIDYSKPFRTACLFRGGAGLNAHYDSTGADIGFGTASVVSMPCAPQTDQATSEDMMYYVECEYRDSNMHYFASNESVSGWTLVENSYREVLDLGTPVDSLLQPRINIFSYTTINSSTPDFVDGTAGSNTADILYVNVTMNVLYDTGKNNSDGTDIKKNYHYSQTVLLNGAKTYNDEGAYSDKFTG